MGPLLTPSPGGSLGALASKAQPLKDCFEKGLKALMCLLLLHSTNNFP